jgi:peptide chain release factor 2
VIHFDLASLKEEVLKNEALINSDDFWNNQKQAIEIVNKNNSIKNYLDTFNKLNEQIVEIVQIFTMLKEEYDQEIHKMLSSSLNILEKQMDEFEIEVLLSGEFDNNNAIVEIHPGAGGTESQDWAQMLFEMYIKYCENNDLKVVTYDYQQASDAGIKSVTFLVKGKYSYGHLKSESGVHRLVRISPFDSSGRRHTSFASVDVVPQVNDNVNIVIEDKDLKIDTYRSSGAGGQNVNKTESAVRITHIPTNIVVTCQNERSQIQNREIAMNILKSRLFQLEVKKKQEEMAKLKGEQKNIEWGSQIRSYVLCPYKLVKDNRSNYEASNVDEVLEGRIEEIINAYLKWSVKND